MGELNDMNLAIMKLQDIGENAVSKRVSDIYNDARVFRAALHSILDVPDLSASGIVAIRAIAEMALSQRSDGRCTHCDGSGCVACDARYQQGSTDQ